ncbi:MAG TPA: T9SS type A sorting domain-containing protein [Bacteroidia bacterium]|nr:T9SS type A sorting domain-containing protein [Bacteroidia bacterium]
MKKALLLSFSMALATFTFAQTRTVDLSTEAIVSPDSLLSSTSGTPMTLTAVLKNNGTDSITVGDSIWYQFIITVGSQKIVGFPSASNPNSFALKSVPRTIASGDTMHVTVSINISLNFLVSTNVNIVFIAHALNRPGLDFEASATLANNQKTKTIPWLNQHGWAVGINDLAANETKVYPNPVKDVLHIEINNDEQKVLSMFDLSGKKVEETMFSENKLDVNVADYKRGFYFYEIKSNNGAVIKTGKICVN